MEVIQWAVGILVTINIAITGFVATQLWAHVIKCGHVAGDISHLKADVERMKQDIGTHETGMRGELHEIAGVCSRHELQIERLERKQ